MGAKSRMRSPSSRTVGLVIRKAPPDPSPPLSVLQIASGDLWGGAEAQVHELCLQLHHDPGIDLSCVLLNDGRLARTLAAAGIQTTILEESRHSVVELLRRLIDRCRVSRPDVIHTHRRKENILGGLAARWMNIPSVRTIHGGPEFDWPVYRLDQHIANFVDRYSARHWQDVSVAVSSELAQRVSARIPAERLVTIPNGVSEARVRNHARAQPHLAFIDGRIRLCFLGRLVPVKRVGRILEAMRILKDTSSNRYQLFVIGNGPEHDRLSQLSDNLGLERDVVFLGHRDDALACLARMNCLVFASEHEGLPMAALEAICLGVRIASTPVGGLPELIDAAHCGTLARSDSGRALAEAIELAIRDKADDAASHPRLPEKWRIESTSNRYIETYLALAGRPPRT